MNSSGQLKKEVVSGVAWTTLTATSVRILAGISGFILAMLLAPEVFGIIAVANVVIGAMELFSDFGVTKALIQYQGDLRRAANVTLTLRLLQGALLFFLCLLFANDLAHFYQTSELRLIIPILGLNFLVSSLGQISMSLLSKDLQFRKQLSPQIIPAFLQVVVSITLAACGCGVWSIVFGYIAMTCAQTYLYWRIKPFPLRFELEGKVARELLSFGIPLFLSGVVWYLFYSLDKMVLGKMVGMKELGYYSFAFIVISLPITEIVFVLNRVMFPAYAKLSDNLEDMKSAYLKTLRYTSLVAIPLLAGIPLFGGDLLKALYGEKWSSSIAPLQAFGIYAFARSFSAISGNIFLAQGKTQYILFNALLSLGLLGIFIYPMTKKLGIVGMAWLYSGVWLITLSVLMVWLKRVIALRFGEIITAIKIPFLVSFIVMIPIKWLMSFFEANVFILILAAFIISLMYYLSIARFDPQAAESFKLSLKERKLRLI